MSISSVSSYANNTDSFSRTDAAINSLLKAKERLSNQMQELNKDKSLDEKSKQEKIKQLQTQLEEMEKRIAELQQEKMLEGVSGDAPKPSGESSGQSDEEKEKEADVTFNRSIIAGSVNLNQLKDLGAVRNRLVREYGENSEQVKRAERLMGQYAKAINKYISKGREAVQSQSNAHQSQAVSDDTVAEVIISGEAKQLSLNMQPITLNDSHDALSINAATMLRQADTTVVDKKTAEAAAFTEVAFEDNRFIKLKNGKMLENTEENRLFYTLDEIAEEYGWGLLDKGRESDIGGVLGKLAEEYAKIRSQIEETYNGGEKDALLAALDKRYGSQVDYIADASAAELHTAKTVNRLKLFASAFRQLPSSTKVKTASDLPETVRNSIDGKTEQFNDLAAMLRDSIVRMGKSAKEYVLAGNTAPISENEKTAFYKYISNGVEIGYGEVDTLIKFAKAISGGADDIEAFQNAAGSVLESGLSDSVKELLTDTAKTKLTYAGSPYAKEIGLLEKQLQDALKQQQSNKSDAKKLNYIDEVDKSRALNESVDKTKEALLDVLTRV